MTDDLGKVAVITGGASGIGFATASLLAKQGWRLVLADIEAPRLEDAAQQLGGGGVSVLCPMRVETNIGNSERNRPDSLGGPGASPQVPDQGETNEDLAGRVIPVEGVAEQVVAAIGTDRLYIVPHGESRTFIRR